MYSCSVNVWPDSAEFGPNRPKFGPTRLGVLCQGASQGLDRLAETRDLLTRARSEICVPKTKTGVALQARVLRRSPLGLGFALDGVSMMGILHGRQEV